MDTGLFRQMNDGMSFDFNLKAFPGKRQNWFFGGFCFNLFFLKLLGILTGDRAVR